MVHGSWLKARGSRQELFNSKCSAFLHFKIPHIQSSKFPSFRVPQFRKSKASNFHRKRTAFFALSTFCIPNILERAPSKAFGFYIFIFPQIISLNVQRYFLVSFEIMWWARIQFVLEVMDMSTKSEEKHEMTFVLFGSEIEKLLIQNEAG